MNNLVKQYKAIKGDTQLSIVPRRFVPRPTEGDYKFGEIVRYFAQQANQSDGEIFEINKSSHTSFKSNPLYSVIKLRWQIAGPRSDSVGGVTIVGVERANEAARTQAAKKMPGIARKLANPLQLYRK